MAAVARELSKLDKDELVVLLTFALTIFCVVYAIYFLIYYFAVFLPEPERFNESRIWMPNFYNHRSFNQVEVWLLPAFFWLCHCARQYSPGRAVMIYLLTSVWWAMLFYSLGRGISLAMVVAMLGVALLFRRQALALLKPALVTLVLGLLFYWLMFLLPKYLYFDELSFRYADRFQELHSGGRVPLWQFAWESFLNNPVFGLGPQHYAYFYERHSHAHNVTLNSLAELGVAGVVPLLGLGLIAAWSIVRGAIAAPSPLSMLLVFCLFAVAVYSQFTAQFYFPAAQLMLILFAGVAIVCTSRSEMYRQGLPVGPAKISMPLAVFFVALSITSLSVSFTDVLLRPHALYEVRYYNYPRVWLNGKFHRFSQRQLAPRPGPCKVHPYAPEFSCR
jgi:O-antigen ligase